MAPDRYSLEHIFVLPSFLLFAFPAILWKKKANISNEETALNNPTVFLFYIFFSLMLVWCIFQAGGYQTPAMWCSGRSVHD